jgi:hypothetical protein
MFRLTTSEDKAMAKAIERARASKLIVRRTGLKRMYHVTNQDNGKTYIVNFFVRHDGARFGTCECPATVICKHIACAAALNIYDATVRHVGVQVAELPKAA